MADFPDQPIVTDEHGVERFKENRIVRDLLSRASGMGMNLNAIEASLARGAYTREEQRQLLQLIGCSVSGWKDAMGQAAGNNGEAPLTEAVERVVYFAECVCGQVCFDTPGPGNTEETIREQLPSWLACDADCEGGPVQITKVAFVTNKPTPPPVVEARGTAE